MIVWNDGEVGGTTVALLRSRRSHTLEVREIMVRLALERKNVVANVNPNAVLVSVQSSSAVVVCWRDDLDKAC